MGNECTSNSLSSHKEWPLALERISQYMQALKLPVSQQSQVLSAVEQKLNSAVITDSLTFQALAFMREALAENENCFSERIVAREYGFDEHRTLSSRTWSMPAISRSTMVPNTRASEQPRFTKTRAGTQAS